MKRADPVVKLARKRQLFIERTALALHVDLTAAEQLLQVKRQQSLRLNPLRYAHKEVLLEELARLGWTGRPFDWMPDGYSLDSGLRAIRDSAAAIDGLVYIQNAASWLPVLALDPKPDEKILDMCAAPGGKTTHIAAITNGQAELWVNDNSRARLAKMRANFVRLKVHPTKETLFDISRLAQKLDGEQFDKILLDAPCSVEGLMTLSDRDLRTWSVVHIKRLQQLQKRAILQAWQLLKPGGMLVYSTCTIAPEENELVVDYLLRKTDNAALQPIGVRPSNQVPALEQWQGRQIISDLKTCLRLAPSPQLEAFFVAKVKKSA